MCFNLKSIDANHTNDNSANGNNMIGASPPSHSIININANSIMQIYANGAKSVNTADANRAERMKNPSVTNQCAKPHCCNVVPQ